MDKILIVPDIHGRKFWEPALNFDGTVVFLGDYTDPYGYEGFTYEDSLQVMNKVIDFKKANPERVTLLVGNHELHYYDKKYECGRFSDDYYEAYHKLLTGEDANLFQLCKQIDNYLFIHAGIVKAWYDSHVEELKKLGETLEEQVNNLFRTNPDAFYEASFYRGGWSEAGSPLWADVHELIEEPEHFDPDIIQIIGHTQLRTDEPMIKEKFFLLDNRRLYLLENEEIKLYED